MFYRDRFVFLNSLVETLTCSIGETCSMHVVEVSKIVFTLVELWTMHRLSAWKMFTSHVPVLRKQDKYIFSGLFSTQVDPAIHSPSVVTFSCWETSKDKFRDTVIHASVHVCFSDPINHLQWRVPQLVRHCTGNLLFNALVYPKESKNTTHLVFAKTYTKDDSSLIVNHLIDTQEAFKVVLQSSCLRSQINLETHPGRRRGSSNKNVATTGVFAQIICFTAR